ncbi:CotH kinase family protein [Luteolibacter marinus]|uniref:CotH kinase family protein n=1 Tax=Luteolibacter marinus TaxID=2776705 RepID=UPI0018692F54|nr:CotH kinase family protein [Luteolibacter marinus]
MKAIVALLGLLSTTSLVALAQAPQDPPFPPPGGQGGPGGPPMMNQAEREVLADHDQDKNGYLDQSERAAARKFLEANPAPARGGPGGRGGPAGRRGPGGFGPRGNQEPARPGARISKDDAKPAGSADLYDPGTLRTLFLDFENADWEAELEAFHGTDVEVPATLTVDGKSYPGVGVHFRGASSYFMVPAGRKRSLNLSLDLVDRKQRIDGYKTLNLLNSNGDGTFLSGALYSAIARQYIPTPKVSLVRVVINGENWGVYVNQQQFNKDFIQENFRTSKGARWKVPGSPNGRGGLDYLGDDIAAYKTRYSMKSGDDDDWKALIQLCKTLDETPADELEAALEPLLDIDATLWFLALDCALINSDGYWTRASDYTLYRDRDGRFHPVPHDMNEAFRAAGGGPGFRGRGGPQGGGNGVKLDPLTAMDDPGKPLRSKLLAVPALRARYLEKVHTIAEQDLDWQNLGQRVAGFRQLIAGEVAADTRKNSTTEAFENLTSDTPTGTEGGGHGAMPLRSFADQRREYLLATPQAASPE